MNSRQRAGGPDRVALSRAGSRPLSARDQALARVSRWKRRIAVSAVVGFGALLGLVSAVGARGSATASTPPSVSDRGGDGGRRVAPRQAPGDGFFGGDDRYGGFGFGDGGSQALPYGRSGAS